MNKHAVLTGTFSVGKTTLLNKLKLDSRLKNYQFIDEVARKYNINTNSCDDLFRLQRNICMEQRCTQSLYRDVSYISDASLIEILAYTRVLSDTRKCSHYTDITARCIAGMKEYTHAIYIPPSIDLVNDGFRYTDNKFRMQIDNEIRNILHTFYTHILYKR